MENLGRELENIKKLKNYFRKGLFNLPINQLVNKHIAQYIWVALCGSMCTWWPGERNCTAILQPEQLLVPHLFLPSRPVFELDPTLGQVQIDNSLWIPDHAGDFYAFISDWNYILTIVLSNYNNIFLHPYTTLYLAKAITYVIPKNQEQYECRCPLIK